MRNFAALIGKYLGLVLFLFLIAGFAIPTQFTWVMGKIGGVPMLNMLLAIIMFGMGMTLKPSDFVLIVKRPGDVILGVVAQFMIMPLVAFSLAKAFDLSPALTAGIVLVGTCPGGTASNIVSFLAKGDVALSVTMTSVSTLLAPILTPFITYQLIGTTISFDPVAMFWSIVQIVILPICIGVGVHSAFPTVARAVVAYLPAVSGISIGLIIAGVIAISRESILGTSAMILAVVILHNVFGYILGFAAARARGLAWKQSITIAIEVGMQNTGLATGLAKAHFAAMPMATVPGAIASAWHTIFGALLASAIAKYKKDEVEEEEDIEAAEVDVVNS